MQQPKIEPHRIEKPIQLLAAWLVGLVLVDGAFLTSAALITVPAWAPGVLVCAAVTNVPLFLTAIFLLQTKFRPEMQGDEHYAHYLDRQTSQRPDQEIASQLTAIRTDFSNANERTLALVDGLQSQIAEVSEVLQTQTTAGASADGAPKLLRQLREKLDSTQEAIAEAKRIAGWERYSVELNDLIPEYAALRQALASASITVDSTFGTTSRDPERPKTLTLSFGAGVDIEHIRVLYSLLSPFGFDHISYSDFSSSPGRIYIGSYSYKNTPEKVHNLADPIVDILMDSATTTEEFVTLLQTMSSASGG